MKVLPFEHLACPLDGEPLINTGKAWVCCNKHSFDIAKQGYTNLLPVQNKRSLDPGDHKEMVAARRCFLNAGFYQPIADAVNQAVFSYGSSADSIHCLDAGCGEGYYLRALAAAKAQSTLSLLGVDISKWAVLSASRRDRQPNWVVGSNANLPVLSNSVDVVLCMFGFPVYTEFSRVLKPNGLLVQVDTGSDHLKELRKAIYPNQKPPGENEEYVPDGFTDRGTESVYYSVRLTCSEDIANLFAMTPHYYRANTEGHARVAALAELTVTVDVKLSIFSNEGD